MKATKAATKAANKGSTKGPAKPATQATKPAIKTQKPASKTAAPRKSARAAAHPHPQEPIQSIGGMVRRARKVGEFTLQEVADDTGLSISYLSQIERDLLTPSVSTLRRIAAALDIPAGSLVFTRESRGSSRLVAVMRAGERKKISFPQSNIDYELLTPDLRRRVSVLRVAAQPGAESGPTLTHEGEDVVIVLKGTLSVEVGEVWHEVPAGDSICFNSELPHRWSNRGRGVAEAIWVSSPPTF